MENNEVKEEIKPPVTQKKERRKRNAPQSVDERRRETSLAKKRVTQEVESNSTCASTKFQFKDQKICSCSMQHETGALRQTDSVTHFNVEEVKEIVQEVWNFQVALNNSISGDHSEMLRRVNVICTTKVVLKYVSSVMNDAGLISVVDLRNILNVVAKL